MQTEAPNTSTNTGGHTRKTTNGVAHIAPASAAITPELLTTGQAAKLCGCGERTLWRWSRCGLAPAPVKTGHGKQGAVRYRRAELFEWIAAGCPRVDGGGADD
jgi:predicted DNA-binding transcriptional regulator AlpA